MTRFLLQPRWLAWHLLLVAVLVSFTWLGRWQLHAFERPRAAPRSDVAPVPLDRLTTPAGRLAAADEGRRVEVVGTYDASGTRLVPGRTAPGSSGRTGFWVVTPLRTASGVLPVVRGWVPTRGSAAVIAPTATATLQGRVEPSEDGPEGSVASAVDRRSELPYVATVTVLDALPYAPGELYDGYLALRTETTAASTPTAAATPTAVPVPVAAEGPRAPQQGGVARWRNLAYALQWWLFALAAVGFWWSVLRRAVREERLPPPGQPTSQPQPRGEGLPPLAAPPRRT